MRLERIPGEPEFMRSFVSSCSHVTGVLSVNDHAVAIHEWQSTRKGRTKGALQELKECYGVVEVNGIGSSPSEESWKYWIHMASAGLVDRLLDDEGMVVPLGDTSLDLGM